ncbi:AEC family transporter, partial [Frankia casuarinae]
MSALIVLLVGLVAGIGVRHRGRLPADTAHVINLWLLDVALPALTLRAMHGIVFPPNLALVIAAPYLLFVLTTAGYVLAGRALRMPREVVVALIATTAVANTSFVGIPMVTAFFGASSVPVAVLVDQLGSFLLLNTVVLGTVTISAGASLSRAELARRVLTAPALIALVAALVLRPVTFPGWLNAALGSLGG